MAFVSTSTHRSTAASGLVARIVDTAATLSVAYDRWRVYRRTQAELNALSTRELSDLGINRSMITRLAYEAAYGRDA